MRICLIANPVSGGNPMSRIERAAGWLRGRGAAVETRLTRQRGDARDFAVRALAGGCDRVVVAGGDGTLNEVANGLRGSALPVAFLPMGTVNVFALETGIPIDLEAACRLADAVSALEALLAHRPPGIGLTLPDGTRRNGFGVVASNARCYGGRYVITPNASLFSDRLELCLLRRGSRRALLGYALRLGLYLPLRPPAVEFHSVAAVEVHGPGVPVQVDGDACGPLPVQLSCLPEALTVVLPK